MEPCLCVFTVIKVSIVESIEIDSGVIELVIIIFNGLLDELINVTNLEKSIS